MLDGTPVLDIKPYMSSVPLEQLRCGWLEDAEKRSNHETLKPAYNPAKEEKHGHRERHT